MERSSFAGQQSHHQNDNRNRNRNYHQSHQLHQQHQQHQRFPNIPHFNLSNVNPSNVYQQHPNHQYLIPQQTSHTTATNQSYPIPQYASNDISRTSLSNDRMQSIIETLAKQNETLLNITNKSNDDQRSEHTASQNTRHKSKRGRSHRLRSHSKQEQIDQSSSDDNNDEWEYGEVAELTDQEIRDYAWNVLGVMVDYNTTGKRLILQHTNLEELHLEQIMAFLCNKDYVDQYGKWYRKKSYLKFPDIKTKQIYYKLKKHYIFKTQKGKKRKKVDIESEDEFDIEEDMEPKHKKMKLDTAATKKAINDLIETEGKQIINTLFNKQNLQNISKEIQTANQIQSKQLQKKLYMEQQQNQIMKHKLQQIEKQKKKQKAKKQKAKKQKAIQNLKKYRKNKNVKEPHLSDTESDSQSIDSSSSSSEENNNNDNIQHDKGTKNMASKSLSDLNNTQSTHQYNLRSRKNKK